MRRGPLVSFRIRCREAEPDGHVGSLVYNDCSSLSGRNDSAAARSHRSLLPAIGPHSRGSPLPLVRMIAATIAASFADADVWYLSNDSRSPLSARRSAINRPQSSSQIPLRLRVHGNKTTLRHGCATRTLSTN